MATVSDHGWRRFSFCSPQPCSDVKPALAGGQHLRWTRPDFEPPFDMFNVWLQEGMWDAFVAAVKNGTFEPEWAAFIAGVKNGEFDE